MNSEQLRFSIRSFAALQEMGVDLIEGGEVDFTNPEVVAKLYVAGSLHLKNPPTLKQATEELDALEVYEAVANSSLVKGAAGAKKQPAKKKRGRPRKIA